MVPEGVRSQNMYFSFGTSLFPSVERPDAWVEKISQKIYCLCVRKKKEKKNLIIIAFYLPLQLCWI